MKKEEFKIPIAGLKNKVYQFEYEIDDSFFDTVGEPLVSQPEIALHLTFDKTNEPYVLDFKISGKFSAECDRCSTPIRVNVDADYRVFMKFGQAEEFANEPEVIYISIDDHEVVLYDHVYDFVHLSIPMVKRCNTPSAIKRCDEKVESYLNNADDIDESEENSGDPRWEALKKLK